MRHAGVHVLVNFDETFIHFYPSDDYVCGATRVGSKIHEDSKIGCTVMVGMEFFSSEMLPPFIVLKPFYSMALTLMMTKRSCLIIISKSMSQIHRCDALAKNQESAVLEF